MMMIKLKTWLIHILGGVTIAEHENEREKHEVWANQYLKAKSGKEINTRIYAPNSGENLLLLRSRVSVINGHNFMLNVAPWCRNIVIDNCSNTEIFANLKE